MISIPITTPNAIEPNSSQPIDIIVSPSSTLPPINAPPTAATIEYTTITTRSATTTVASTVRLSGPSARVSASSATTTAGDCADSATATIAQIANVCVIVVSANIGNSGCRTNSTAASTTIAPSTPNAVIARSVLTSGFTRFRSSSPPADKPRMHVATPLTTLSEIDISLETSPSTYGPATTPTSR